MAERSIQRYAVKFNLAEMAHSIPTFGRSIETKDHLKDLRELMSTHDAILKSRRMHLDIAAAFPCPKRMRDVRLMASPFCDDDIWDQLNHTNHHFTPAVDNEAKPSIEALDVAKDGTRSVHQEVVDELDEYVRFNHHGPNYEEEDEHEEVESECNTGRTIEYILAKE